MRFLSVYPLLRAFLMSFYTKYKFSTDTVLSYGVSNYTYIFGDSVFQKALSNTFIYVLFVVPISIAISLVLAVLLNEKIRMRGFFQTVYFSAVRDLGGGDGHRVRVAVPLQLRADQLCFGAVWHPARAVAQPAVHGAASADHFQHLEEPGF